ncbi:MAG: hypothetical protein K2H60_09955, partial [Muribaculaceae bacterium]|nr:hypothetical protein [Muribaculaceae bacterium]
YKSLGIENLNKQKINISNKIKESDDSISSLSAESYSIENEREKTQSKIASVKKRIERMEQNEREYEKKLKEISDDILNVKNKIEEVSARINDLDQKYRINKDKYAECLNNIESTKQDIREKETELYKIRSVAERTTARSEIKKLKMDLVNEERNASNTEESIKIISIDRDKFSSLLESLQQDEVQKTTNLNECNQHFQAIHNSIQQDKYLFDHLLQEATTIKQRRSDIKSAIGNLERSNEAQKREYDVFMKRRAEVLNYLQNFTR